MNCILNKMNKIIFEFQIFCLFASFLLYKIFVERRSYNLLFVIKYKLNVIKNKKFRGGNFFKRFYGICKYLPQHFMRTEECLKNFSQKCF